MSLNLVTSISQAGQNLSANAMKAIDYVSSNVSLGNLGSLQLPKAPLGSVALNGVLYSNPPNAPGAPQNAPGPQGQSTSRVHQVFDIVDTVTKAGKFVGKVLAEAEKDSKEEEERANKRKAEEAERARKQEEERLASTQRERERREFVNPQEKLLREKEQRGFNQAGIEADDRNQPRSTGSNFLTLKDSILRASDPYTKETVLEQRRGGQVMDPQDEAVLAEKERRKNLRSTIV